MRGMLACVDRDITSDRDRNVPQTSGVRANLLSSSKVKASTKVKRADSKAASSSAGVWSFSGLGRLSRVACSLVSKSRRISSRWYASHGPANTATSTASSSCPA